MTTKTWTVLLSTGAFIAIHCAALSVGFSGKKSRFPLPTAGSQAVPRPGGIIENKNPPSGVTGFIRHVDPATGKSHVVLCWTRSENWIHGTAAFRFDVYFQHIKAASVSVRRRTRLPSRPRAETRRVMLGSWEGNKFISYVYRYDDGTLRESSTALDQRSTPIARRVAPIAARYRIPFVHTTQTDRAGEPTEVKRDGQGLMPISAIQYNPREWKFKSIRATPDYRGCAVNKRRGRVTARLPIRELPVNLRTVFDKYNSFP